MPRRNEAPEEVDGPQKHLKFLHCAGLGKVPHGCQLLGDPPQTPKKLALCLVEDQTVVLKAL